VGDFVREGVPLYVQIANSIAERIRSGELGTGDQLPSERQLAEELLVSRMTVRQALLALRQQGLVDGQHGRGTFITQPRIEQPVDVLIGFSDNMVKRGIKPSARLLKLESILANREIAAELQLHLGESVYAVHRLRLANDIPAALEYSHFPAHCCPGLDSHDLEGRSVYAILAEEYGIHLTSAYQSLEPVVATAQQAQRLTISKGAPLMLVTRTSYDEQQRVVEFAQDLYRGDYFRFVSGARPSSP
jgi:GntR family transcriptional regulator